MLVDLAKALNSFKQKSVSSKSSNSQQVVKKLKFDKSIVDMALNDLDHDNSDIENTAQQSSNSQYSKNIKK